MPQQDLIQSLLNYLQTQMPYAKNLTITDFSQPSDGWIDEAFLFVLNWEEKGVRFQHGLAVRKLKKGGLMSEESDLRKHYKVLEAVGRGSRLPVAKVHWYEEDERILGSPFFVMDKLPGRSYTPWSNEGIEFLRKAHDDGEIPKQFVQYLAELHQMDYKKLGLTKYLHDPGEGSDFIDYKLAEIERLCEKYQPAPDPILTDALLWLKKHRPQAQKLVLIHGDYRTGNMLYEDKKITGILDWEAAEIGDPMMDVAYVCAKANRMDSPLLCYLLGREWFLSMYSQLTGFTIDEKVLHYYEVFHQVRFMLLSLAAHYAFTKSGNNDLRMARQGYRIPLMRNLLAELLGY